MTSTQEVNLTKLNKQSLLEKCKELGIENYKYKNKSELIELIKCKPKIIIEDNVTDTIKDNVTDTMSDGIIILNKLNLCTGPCLLKGQFVKMITQNIVLR